jgi:hypothetical protein
VDGHNSEIGLGFGLVVSGQFKGAKDVKRSKRKRKRKAKNEEKRKKEKSRGRRKWVWNLDGSKNLRSTALHAMESDKNFTSVVYAAGGKICAHSSAECVAISA